jgi:hypothetical protein
MARRCLICTGCPTGQVEERVRAIASSTSSSTIPVRVARPVAVTAARSEFDRWNSSTQAWNRGCSGVDPTGIHQAVRSPERLIFSTSGFSRNARHFSIRLVCRLDTTARSSMLFSTQVTALVGTSAPPNAATATHVARKTRSRSSSSGSVCSSSASRLASTYIFFARCEVASSPPNPLRFPASRMLSPVKARR